MDYLFTIRKVRNGMEKQRIFMTGTGSWCGRKFRIIYRLLTRMFTRRKKGKNCMRRAVSGIGREKDMCWKTSGSRQKKVPMIRLTMG